MNNSGKPLKEKISITLDQDVVEKIKILAEEDDRSMSAYKKNIERLDGLKTFKSKDNKNAQLPYFAIRDMRYVVEQCEILNLPQPEIVPYTDGRGIQAKWNYDWYLEIYNEYDVLHVFFIKGNDCDNAIQINDVTLGEAFELVKTFLNCIVDLNGCR